MAIFPSYAESVAFDSSSALWQVCWLVSSWQLVSALARGAAFC
jgi:hypothetical protein